MDPITAFFVNLAISFAVAAVVAAVTPAQKIKGARLEDRGFTSNTLGKTITEIYGTIDTYGNVFWFENNEYEEVSKTRRVGKSLFSSGQKVTEYTYFATCAVGLCRGPILGVSRVWLQDELIYNGGVFTTPTAEELLANPTLGQPQADFIDVGKDELSNSIVDSIRVYLGSETQLPDPLIEADDPNTPAYRGLAYALLRRLQVDKYGRALPQKMKFEVVKSGTTSAPTLVQTNTVGAVGENGWVQSNAQGGTMWFVKTAQGPFAGDQVIAKKRVSVSGDLVEISYDTLKNPPSQTQYYLDCPIYGLDYYYILRGNVGSVYTTFISKGFRHGRIEGKSDTLANLTGASTQRMRAAMYYPENKVVYAISGASSSSTDDSPYIWGFDRLGGNALYEAQIPGSNGDNYALWVNDDGVWTVSDSGAGGVNGIIHQYTHDLTILTNSWDVSTDVGGMGDGLRATIYMMGNRAMLSNGAEIQIFDLNADGTYTHVGGDAVSGTSDNHHPAIASSTLVYIRDKIYRIDDVITSTSAQLDAIVQDICVQSGYDTGDLNVTQLAGKTIEGIRYDDRESAASRLEPLRGLHPFDITQGYQLKFVPRGGSSVLTLTGDDLAARPAGEDIPEPFPVSSADEAELPRRVNVSYLSRERDYSVSMQYDSRNTVQSDNQLTLELPMVLTDTQGKTIANVVLNDAWIERESQGPFFLPMSFIKLEPTDVITVNYQSVTYNVRLTQEDIGRPGLIECLSVSDDAALYTPTVQAVTSPPSNSVLKTIGPTVYYFLDAPLLTQDDSVGWYVGVDGFYNGWHGGTLYKSLDGGGTSSPHVALPDDMVVGRTTNALAAAVKATVIDEANTVNIALSKQTDTLSSITRAQMMNGSNLAIIGAEGRWEVISFMTRTVEADATVTLSNLLRGRYGTEHNMGNHAADDIFVLLPSNLDNIPRAIESAAEIGVERHFKAVSSGIDPFNGTYTAHTFNAVSSKPYAPVHVRSVRNASGDIQFHFRGRSRYTVPSGGWRALHVDSESDGGEAYEVDVMSGSTVVRTLSGADITISGSLTYGTYTAAQQSTDSYTDTGAASVKIYKMNGATRGYVAEATV